MISTLDFCKKYPIQTAAVSGFEFPYRYHENERSNVTVLLLIGGLGLSVGFRCQFDMLAAKYSVILFDYPAEYRSNRELAGAIAALLRQLRLKVFIVGQSYGGFLAQIIAQQHRDVVEGIVLSNTGTLSVDLCEEAVYDLKDMLKQVNSTLFLLNLLPFGSVNRTTRKKIMERARSELTEPSLSILKGFCDDMKRLMTKEYAIHMSRLLKDLKNHWNMRSDDFSMYRGRVLLLLSEDDDTFCDEVKRAVIDVMPAPKVKADIRGGHMAFLFSAKEYVCAIQDFIDSAVQEEPAVYPERRAARYFSREAAMSKGEARAVRRLGEEMA